MDILGHIIGFVALAFFFASYQIREKKWLLVAQTGATLLICIQYLLIGATAGFAVNLLCLVRNFVYFAPRARSFLRGWFFPLLFAASVPVVILFFWDGYHALFLMSALMINTVCLGVCTPQGVRRSILLTSTLVILYNIFAGSISGICNESVAILSSAIGLFRFHKQTRAPKDVR